MAKVRFTHRALLTRWNALVLKVGVLCGWLVAKCVAVTAKEEYGNALLTIHIAAKDILPAIHY